MPELPDVEGFRRKLADHLPGRRVAGVRVVDDGVLRNTTPRALGRALRGQRFGRPSRHGKWLVLPTGGPALLIHSGMTGHPYYSLAPGDERHDRVIVALDRGELRYADQRKLRGIWLVADENDVEDVTGPQGPDALSVRPKQFADALRGRRGGLKSALLDQEVIAGLGNLLADEICWRAEVNPGRPAGALDADAVRALHTAMRRTLRTAVRHGRVPDLRGWLTSVRNEDGGRCPRCHTLLAHARRAGRATVWCPRCQPD
jgi:formamidopyrimidine-DNA glycosylase